MGEDLSKWLSDILAAKEDRAVVYIESPYSFCVVVANGIVAVLDSWPQGNGPLVAMSLPEADMSKVVHYISTCLER